MASLPVTPTLCSLTYDSDYDRRTPYRYPCWTGRNVVSSPLDTTFSLPSSGCSISYLEYLRALYESKALNTPKSTGHHSSGAGGPLSRSPYTTANLNSYAASYGYIDNRPKTAFIPHSRPIEPHQLYSLPSLHQGRGWGPEIEEEENDNEEEYEEKLIWVDALNRWIPDPQLPPRNYLSFVGTAPGVAKLYASLKEHLDKDHVESGGRGRYCSRYEMHMESHKHTDKCGLCGHFHQACPQSLDHVHTQRLVTLQRREALMKKRASDAEEKKQRKAYSTPLYTPVKDKRQKVRFSAPESVSLVTSPVSDADIISLPKESWDTMAHDKKDEMAESDVTETLAEDLGYVVVTLEDIQEATEALEAHEAAQLAEKEAKEKADAKLAWALEMQKKQQMLKAEQAEKERLAALAAAQEEEEKARLAMKTSTLSGSGSLHKKMSAALTRSSKSVTKSSSTKLSKKTSSKLKISSSKGDTPDAPSTQAIPTVGDTHIGPLSLTVDQQERPSSRSRSPAGKQRKFSTVKRERVGHRRKKEELTATEEAPTNESKKTSSWIYDDDDDFSETVEKQKEDTKEIEVSDWIPDLPDPDSYKSCSQSGHSNKRRTVIQTPIVTKLNNKLKRRPFVKDTSYEEELRRQEQSERRRQKHMEMLEKMKAKKASVGWNIDDGEDGPNFEDFGFLAKYCIFNKSNIEMYRHTFDVVDEERRGWLSGSDVMVALRAVNNKLSESEENYLYRLLEMIGYNVRIGADFKLFSVMAALSQKISALDNWMKNVIGRMDFKMLEMKMFMCKKLWECNVDPGTNKITIDQLCVELRAGGVSNQHELEVRQKLSHMDDLDLLDFLTYIPLFIMIHQSVVDNPLDDVRNK